MRGSLPADASLSYRLTLPVSNEVPPAPAMPLLSEIGSLLTFRTAITGGALRRLRLLHLRRDLWRVGLQAIALEATPIAHG